VGAGEGNKETVGCGLGTARKSPSTTVNCVCTSVNALPDRNPKLSFFTFTCMASSNQPIVSLGVVGSMIPRPWATLKVYLPLARHM